MSYHFYLFTASGGPAREYPTYADASLAMRDLVTSADDAWELVRTDDRSQTWPAVLSGVGPPKPGTCFAMPRHYPPE